jgi:mono/diheme cytochrome c family protein
VEAVLKGFVLKHQRLLLYVTAAAAIGIIVYLNSLRSMFPAADLVLGKQVYDANCASCHGPNGEGENPSAPLEPGSDGLFPAPPHDETGHTWHHSDALIEQIIREGRIDEGFKPMPAFGDQLTDEEIDAVMAYIKTWWTSEQIEIQATISAQESQP